MQGDVSRTRTCVWLIYYLSTHFVIPTRAGAYGVAMVTLLLRLHSNALMLLYKSAKSNHNIENLFLDTKIDIL